MCNANEPDWVNHGPELDDLPPEQRCQYEFEEDYEYERRSVQDRRCGLCVPDDDIGRDERLCYFHSQRDRKTDLDLKARLEEVVERGAYLQRANLFRGNLEGAYLVDGNLQRAYLRGANLQSAYLQDANLQGADFFGANLQRAHLGDANLQRASLRATDLRGADLGCAKLRGANLGRAKLQLAKMGDIDLHSANLGGANLHGAKLGGARLFNAHLRHAIIVPCQKTDRDMDLAITEIPVLRHARLQGALLAAATIAPEANLAHATFGFSVTRRWFPWQRCGWIGLRGICRWWRLRKMRWTEYHIRDERCAYSDQEWEKAKALHDGLKEDNRPSFSECEAVYRQLKLNYQESGDYQTAGEFFVREMECKRAQMVQDQKQAFFAAFWGRCGVLLLLFPVAVALVLGMARVPAENPWWFALAGASVPFAVWAWLMGYRAMWAAMYLLCGYGERPSWIVGWILALILIFAGCHTWAGVADLKAGTEVDAATPNGVVHSFWTALYFSVITFTSLGYADLAPAPGIGRALAGLEAVLGIVMMSLFLICIVRKYSR